MNNSVTKRPSLIYTLQGRYSYVRLEDPDIEYIRYLNDRDVDEWVEHAFQIVTPYTTVRVTLEVFE